MVACRDCGVACRLGVCRKCDTVHWAERVLRGPTLTVVGAPPGARVTAMRDDGAGRLKSVQAQTAGDDGCAVFSVEGGWNYIAGFYDATEDRGWQSTHWTGDGDVVVDVS